MALSLSDEAQTQRWSIERAGPPTTLRLAQLRRAAGSGRLDGADATSQSSDRSTDGEAEAEPKDEAAKLPKPPPLEQEVV